MRIAVGSDERSSLTDRVVRDLEDRGHEVVLIGALAGSPLEWADAGRAVAMEVAEGHAACGIGFCWTGTGFSIAANKVPGVRAALCTDSETARGARKWNDANVLVMSLRLTSEEIAHEILDAWFTQEPEDDQAEQIAKATG
ncbi:MAG: galactose isomerase [Acidobacteria bacterium]|nr:MAG: galactose isomerase [Acidobacteriota bacterium]